MSVAISHSLVARTPNHRQVTVFTLITTQNFVEEVMRSDTPVLLAFLQNGLKDSENEKLEVLASLLGAGIKICVLDDQFFDEFKFRLHVPGTPTYLLFTDGREVGRLLGRADQATLAEFVSRSVMA